MRYKYLALARTMAVVVFVALLSTYSVSASAAAEAPSEPLAGHTVIAEVSSGATACQNFIAGKGSFVQNWGCTLYSGSNKSVTYEITVFWSSACVNVRGFVNGAERWYSAGCGHHLSRTVPWEITGSSLPSVRAITENQSSDSNVQWQY